jgi:hypothetical protein
VQRQWEAQQQVEQEALLHQDNLQLQLAPVVGQQDLPLLALTALQLEEELFRATLAQLLLEPALMPHSKTLSRSE